MIINSTIDKITINLQTGKTPPSKEEKYFNGGLNWYTPSDLNKKLLSESKRTITKLAYEDKKATIYPKGTVLLSCIGDIGKLGIVTDDTSSSNQQITGLIPDTNKITSEYLYYWCLAHKKVFESKATLGTLPMLNNKKLRKIKISYDNDKNNQIKIANLLSQVETLIAKREESIELLDELLKSTFLDMFGDPVLNTKGWDKAPLSQLGKINRGISKHRPRNAPELLGGKYPLIQTGDVSNADLYVEKYTQTYSDIGLAQSKLWAKDTLCITIAANIAKTAILKFDACFPDSIVGMEINKEETNLFYVHFLFKFFQKLLEKNAPQAAQKNINLQILRNLKVPKPDKTLQNKFATIVQEVESTKAYYQESLDELNELFGSLSQRAFRGELDLNSSIVIERHKVEHIKGRAKSGAGVKVSDAKTVRVPSSSGSGEDEVVLDVPKFIRKADIDNVVKIAKSIDTEQVKSIASEVKELQKSLSMGDTIKQLTETAKLFKDIKIPSIKIDLPPFYSKIPSIDIETTGLFKTSQQLMESMKKREEHIYKMLEDIPQIRKAMEEGVLCKDDFLELPLRYDYEYANIKKVIMYKLKSAEIAQEFDETNKVMRLVKV